MEEAWLEVFVYTQIEDILKSYSEVLGQIAYMLTEDINRLITDEAQVRFSIW